MTEPEFELFTSLRYDPRLLAFAWNTWEGYPPSPFFHLPYHYDRLVQAAQKFSWPAAVQLLINQEHPIEFIKSLCDDCVSCQDDPQQPLKIRVVLSQNGNIKVQCFQTTPLEHDLLVASTFNPDFPGDFQYPSRQLKIYLDTEATPQSAYTSYKTTSRSHYDAARARLGISAAGLEEVLLYNPHREITEGSVRNAAFWRSGQWVTPDLASGCLAGTVRQWLLEQGRIVEGKVKCDDVREGEWVLVSNAVEGCLLGKIYKRN